jgi:ribosomal protein S18 acetylase RimI-like enzyme
VCLVATLDGTGDAVAIASLSFSENARGNPGADTNAMSGSRSIPCPRDAAYLCNVAVDANHRGRGIAKNILSAAEGLCAERGHDAVWLHVRTSDPVAFGLYEKAGYEVEARETPSGPSGPGGFLAKVFGGGNETAAPYDVALMRKRIESGDGSNRSPI